MAESVETPKKEKLSVALTIIAWLAMLIFTFHACTHMVAAGDTWVAMACGRHFINQGVDTVEPFSANSHHAGPTKNEVENWPNWAKWITEKVGLDTVKKWHPTGWINQNWLTHVIFYYLTHISPVADAHDFSFNTLVYWKFSVYIFALLCVYFTARIMGTHRLLAAAFTCFAFFVGRSFIDVRPAAYSNLFVAAFLLILVLTTYRSHLYIWLLVPIAAFWANLHGGYIYLFIMFVPFFVLHLLQILPKRWKIPLFSILSWIVFYLVLWKFAAGNKQIDVQISRWLPWGLLFFSAGCIITAFVNKRNKPNDYSLLYGYHIFAWVLVFILLFAKFFPALPSQVALKGSIQEYLNKFRISFLELYFGAIAVGCILTFLKDKLVLLRAKHIWHTAAAGVTTFIAVVVLNPFHLTNLTHTFIISVSEFAKQWRVVNEWHPAFEWENPVGTGFPFLVMVVFTVCVVLLWLYSRYLYPKKLKAPANEIENQSKRFYLLLKLFGWVVATFAAWITCISFSLLRADPAGLILCAAFSGIILLSILKNVHFIYLIGLLTIITLALTGSGTKGYAGRYIFPFLIVPAYVIMFTLASIFSRKTKAEKKDIVFPLITAVLTVVVMSIIFNPLKIKLPQYDGIIFNWIGGLFENLWNLRRTWKPVYEANLKLTYRNLFSYLYIINILAVVIWITLPNLRNLFCRLSQKEYEQKEKISENQTFVLPKLDLAYFLIVALTIYMAYRSRRFIPIAAFAACPLIALFITHISKSVNASLNFHTKKKLVTNPIPYSLKLFAAVLGTCVVIFFGLWWTLKFQKVYLGSWPTDKEFTSVFMRMTASDRKPFHAGEFIRTNQLQGKMFNYWTEGGFLAWAQQPDPNTGKTPLQLFMDGRAQAAYDYSVFISWSKLQAGGPRSYQVRMRGRKLKQKDYIVMGKYISEVLRKRDVWLILMPVNDNTEQFRKAIRTNREWPLVFFNDKQRMYVDVKSQKGKKLLAGALTGETKYPNQFTKSLFLARTYLSHNDLSAKKKGLEYAQEALKLKSEDEVIKQFIYALNTEQLREQTLNILQKHIRNFEENKDKYIKQNGYYNRAAAALATYNLLTRVAVKKGDEELADSYREKTRNIKRELPEIFRNKRW